MVRRKKTTTYFSSFSPYEISVHCKHNEDACLQENLEYKPFVEGQTSSKERNN
jgi:hypothetical protein